MILSEVPDGSFYMQCAEHTGGEPYLKRNVFFFGIFEKFQRFCPFFSQMDSLGVQELAGGSRLQLVMVSQKQRYAQFIFQILYGF